MNDRDREDDEDFSVSQRLELFSNLLFLRLSLQQTLISVMLETSQFILQLLAFSLCPVELILRILPQPPQGALMLHQQAVTHDFLGNRAAKNTNMD